MWYHAISFILLFFSEERSLTWDRYVIYQILKHFMQIIFCKVQNMLGTKGTN